MAPSILSPTARGRLGLARVLAVTAALLVALTAELVPASAVTASTSPAARVAVAGPVAPAATGTALPTYTWMQYLCNRSRYRLPRLGYGSRGYAVSVLQLSLKRMGFYSKRVDGSFGPVTYRGVRNFQRAARIVVDGRVGPQTWGAIQWYVCD